MVSEHAPVSTAILYRSTCYLNFIAISRVRSIKPNGSGKNIFGAASGVALAYSCPGQAQASAYNYATTMPSHEGPFD